MHLFVVVKYKVETQRVVQEAVVFLPAPIIIRRDKKTRLISQPG